MHKLNGFLSTIIGLLLIFNPELFMDFGFQILGFLLLIIGSGMLYFAFLLKGLGHSLLGDENVIEDIDSE